jgi:hypothetical protein
VPINSPNKSSLNAVPINSPNKSSLNEHYSTECFQISTSDKLESNPHLQNLLTDKASRIKKKIALLKKKNSSSLVLPTSNYNERNM